MNRRIFLILASSLIVLFTLISSRTPFQVKAVNGYKVHNADTGLNYASIQEAINANQTLDAHTIFVDSGIFHEHVTISKSLSIIGQSRYNTTIDGNRTGTVVNIIADNVSLEEFMVTNGSIGISVNHSKNSLISRNTLVDNVDAIVIRYSTDCMIANNILGNNTNRGILVTNSGNFTVSRNSVYGTGWYGINANTSINGKIVQNHVYNNSFDGIGLFNSSNCEIAGNDVSDNISYGILIDFHSSHNSIYHNNVIDNGITVTSPGNFWNSSREGNYWSGYVGVDADHDGIGDAPHTIEGESQDFHPLMGRFNSFDISLGNYVNVISNSTIEDFQYSEANSTIMMHVSNSSEGQTHGFCRVRIPHTVMTPTAISVVIANGSVPALHTNYTLQDDGAHRWIYFAYSHSMRRIDIIPESPSILILIPLVAGCLFVVFKRKHTRH